MRSSARGGSGGNGRVTDFQNRFLEGFFCFSAQGSVCNRGEKLSIGGQSKERPTVPIHIVFQVEYFWKTSAGNLIFRPRAVGVLVAGKVFDSPFDAFPVRVIESAQTH